MTYFKNICIIPAKLNSTRLKHKNILKLGKKSLLENTIKKAINTKLFDKIIINTESEKIINKLKIYKKIEIIKRPKYLSKDPYTISDIVLFSLLKLKQKGIYFKYSSVLLPTSPFFLVDDILKAFKLFIKKKPHCLISVSKNNFPPYNAYLIDKKMQLNFCFQKSKYKYKKSTECPDTFKSNGGVMIINNKIFLEYKKVHLLKKIGYESKKWSFVDIDQLEDYTLSKIIFDKYYKKDNKNFYV